MVTAMLNTSIGIGYWVLVLLEANIIGYWMLGALFGITLFGIVLTLNVCREY